MLFKATTGLEELRTMRCAAVNSLRLEKIDSGFMFNGIKFDIDQQAMINMSATMGAVLSGIGIPPGFVWRSADNVNIPMDVPTFTSLAASAMAYVNGIYVRSWALKDEINESQYPERIDITTGWPS